MIGRCGVLLFALVVLGCSGDGGQGPDQDVNLGRRLTSLSTVWSHLEWSPDGTSIYLVPGVFTPGGDRLLEINVRTGVTDTLATCVAPEQLVAATPAGIAYLGDCGSSSSLHLLSQNKDTVLATGVSWAVRTFDRTRLVYGVFDDPPTGPPGYSVTVLELGTLTAYQVPVSGIPPTYPDPVFISPDGAELLAYGAGTPTILARLSLANGSWNVVSQPWDNPVFVGWGDAGLLLLHGFSGDSLKDGLTGHLVAHLPEDPRFITHAWEVGFVDPDRPRVALGSRGCIRNQPNGYCGQSRQTLWVRNLTTSSMTNLASSESSSLASGGRGRLFGRGAFSPDGGSIAYIIDGDVYLAATP